MGERRHTSSGLALRLLGSCRSRSARQDTRATGDVNVEPDETERDGEETR